MICTCMCRSVSKSVKVPLEWRRTEKGGVVSPEKWQGLSSRAKGLKAPQTEVLGGCRERGHVCWESREGEGR